MRCKLNHTIVNKTVLKHKFQLNTNRKILQSLEIIIERRWLKLVEVNEGCWGSNCFALIKDKNLCRSVFRSEWMMMKLSKQSEMTSSISSKNSPFAQFSRYPARDSSPLIASLNILSIKILDDSPKPAYCSSFQYLINQNQLASRNKPQNPYYVCCCCTII